MLKAVLLSVMLLQIIFAQAVQQPSEQLVFYAYNRDADIYRINSDGTDLRNLTDNEDIQDRNPTWSPDGTQIAFLSNRANPETPVDYGIYVMDANGERVRSILEGVGLYTVPAWSPDGSLIAYQADTFVDKENPCEISIVNPTSGERRELVRLSACIDYKIQWSPDGTRLLFGGANAESQDYDVFIVNIEDAVLQNLTATQGDYSSAEDGAPYWSPDGTQVSFVSNRDRNNEIYLIDAAGGVARRLTDNLGSDVGIRWEKDGHSIILGSERDEQFNLYRLDVESGALTALTQDTNEKFCWEISPSGAQIAFAAIIKPPQDQKVNYVTGDESTDALMVINADGSNLYALPLVPNLESLCLGGWRTVPGQ